MSELRGGCLKLGKYTMYRVTINTWQCCSGTLSKVTCPVYGCTVAYTGQVLFTRCQKHTVMFIWLGCIIFSVIGLKTIKFEMHHCTKSKQTNIKVNERGALF